jgi:hypothetical protein
LKYKGFYYSQALDKAAIAIETDASVLFHGQYFTILPDVAGHKVLSIRTWETEFLDYTRVSSFNLFNSTTGVYKTLQELVNEINSFYYEILGIKIYLFRAYVKYGVEPYGALSSEFINLCSDTKGIYSNGVTTLTPYAHVATDLDNISTDINQGIYKVYYDTDFRKKLSIKFNKVIKDGPVISVDNAQTSEEFVFHLQDDTTGEFKTLDAVCVDISTTLYRGGPSLFSAENVFQQTSDSGPATAQHIIADNIEKFLGYDMQATLLVDTKTVDIKDPATARSIVNAQTAYYSFPLYTSNGNPNKTPIEGIPVSGIWDPNSTEPVLSITCENGTSWELTFNDYESGSYKSFNPAQILKKIDSTSNTITEAEFQSIRSVEDKPQVSMIKELVLRRVPYVDDPDNPGATKNVLKINLRQHSTINAVVKEINETRFNESDIIASGGPKQLFSAELVGDPDVQGEYKSFELDAQYSPIIRSFYVIGENNSVSRKENFIVGWNITKITSLANELVPLSMSAKRYSSGASYGFTAKDPKTAYEDILSNNPLGFRKDTLAFDLFCWDDDGYYEIKDDGAGNNWLYLRSAHVGYSLETDQFNQPDKIIGYGIPLAGCGGVPENENIGELVTRINSFGVINKWFYANLRFTRYSDTSQKTVSAVPGFFEYGYLPNIHANIPKSKLDDIMLRNDTVMSLAPGSGYQFTTSSYAVHNTAKTLDLSCDWVYDYVYEKNYSFNSGLYNTVSGLAAAINVDTSALLGSSVFEANVVGSHGSDVSATLLPESGTVSEASENMTLVQVFENFTVNTSTSEFLVARGDWLVNDVVRFSTTGSLPVTVPGIVPGVDYYVKSVSGTAPSIRLKISTTIGGPQITVTNSGLGTHTITRQTYDIQVNRTDWFVNDIVKFTNVGGALPSPLVVATNYYVTSFIQSGSFKTLKIAATFSGTPITFSTVGTGIHAIHRIYNNLFVSVLTQVVSALQIKVRNMSGAGFIISDPAFSVSSTTNSLTLRCSIRYSHTYTLVGMSLAPYTLGTLTSVISNITDYSDVLFPPLFSSELEDSFYTDKEATRLLEVLPTAITSDTKLLAKLDDLVAFNILSMYKNINVTVPGLTFNVDDFGHYSPDMPTDKKLHTWIDDVLYGDYKKGMISLDAVPLKIQEVTYGLPNISPAKQLVTDNIPAPVYFGILGDIQWMQVSDNNLHTQLNYVKERLGKPWDGAKDYYTPQEYNINNPTAIDLANFLGYMRSVRYNQIKDSIVNEAIVSNKYFWLYMKFHKEFGCDQRVLALAKQIASKQSDQNTLGDME